jgi:hypothetical protein
MEGKQWMMVDGRWTEVEQTQAIRAIKKATGKEIEEVSLRIFETFLKKL